MKIKDKTTEYKGGVLGGVINDNKKAFIVWEVTNPKVMFGNNWKGIKDPIQEWIKNVNKDIAFFENLIKKGYTFDRNAYRDSLKTYSINGVEVKAKSVNDAIKKVKDASRKSLVEEAELAITFLKRGSYGDDKIALNYLKDVVKFLERNDITD